MGKMCTDSEWSDILRVEGFVMDCTSSTSHSQDDNSEVWLRNKGSLEDFSPLSDFMSVEIMSLQQRY